MAQGTGSLSLSQAVALALERNPDCIAARASADASRARIWSGIAPPPPSLAFTYDFIPAGSGIASYGERAVVLTQSFDFPSTTVLRGSALSSEADAADGDMDITALTVTLHVTRAYFTVLARTEKLRLAIAHAEIARDVAEKARIRANVGEASDLERLSARIQEVQATGAVENAKNDLTLSAGELRLLLGQSAVRSEEFPVLTDTLGHRHGTFDTDRLIAGALQSHPLLKRARAQRDVASTGRALAWSSFLPSFTLSYAQQVQGTMSGLYGVSLGVSLPIWFLFDQRGQIQEANARYTAVSSGLTGQEDAVAHNIRNAYLDLTNAEREVHLYAEELLPQSEEIFRVAETSYQAGDIPYTEYLQARQTLIGARVGFVEALLRHNTAFAQLEYAVGHDLSGRQSSNHE
jgi:cobalt-zinc-cadmium efflux system outer membrane protein